MVFRDVTEQKKMEEESRLNEARLQALVQLNQMAGASLQEITDFALESAVELTNSKIGYLAFLNDDESVMTMHSWSKTAMQECAIIDKPIVYPVVNTGLWGEAVRQRKAQALAPADFLRCAISYRSFSFIWCNPPYDYATGEEGRVESQFLGQGFPLARRQRGAGFGLPEDVANSYQTVDFFQERFYEISAMPFPREVPQVQRDRILLGCKRKLPCIPECSGHAGIGWKNGWIPESSTRYLRESGLGNFVNWNQRIRNRPRWWHRVHYGSILSIQRQWPMIGPGRR